MTYPDSLRIGEYMAKDTEMGRTKYPKYILLREVQTDIDTHADRRMRRPRNAHGIELKHS